MKNGERWPPPGWMLQGRLKKTFNPRNAWWWAGFSEMSVQSIFIANGIRSVQSLTSREVSGPLLGMGRKTGSGTSSPGSSLGRQCPLLNPSLSTTSLNAVKGAQIPTRGTMEVTLGCTMQQDRDTSMSSASCFRCSVTNSSYGLIFVKIRAKYGRIFSKNTSKIRAKIRAKFIFTTKNSKIKNEQNALFS